MSPVSSRAERTIRCAIYTRKSSEEGLEQDFNSLHAQREACAAYVLSQASEGWALLPDIYDDGGISGGTLERPALQRLLADIAAKKIDIVVVYKVDRLTRSLLDFSKLVEAFDAAGTSFVSVTQSFNTTTSMGRLTLNMLLSFAQFEREVTAERIRDKIAASKAKGMWMGGVPPLGYEPDGRTLKIVEHEAALVRDIYRRYLDTGNVRLVAEALMREGVRSPARTRVNGSTHGGYVFTRGKLYHLLRNPIYIGKIPHKGQVHEGQHQAIVDPLIWEQVQARLNGNIQGARHTRSPRRSPLAGRIVDHKGEPLIATHACRPVPSGAEGGKVRYRYYVSRDLHQGDRSAGLRIPAREIERVVTDAVANLFDDPVELVAQCALSLAPERYATFSAQCATIEAQLRGGGSTSPLPRLLDQVRVLDDRIDISMSATTTSAMVEMPLVPDAPDTFIITCDAGFRKTGHSLKLVQSNGALVPGTDADPTLIKLLVRGRRWWGMLMEGELDTTSLAAREGVTRSYLTRVVRMAFLAPGVVEALLDGRLKADVDVAAFTEPEAIPSLWRDQERKFLAG